MPAAFADVAAPMQKLWVLNLVSSRPACFKTVDRRDLKPALVSGVPSGRMNNGPGLLPRTAKYGSNALTGHTGESVRPRHNLTPLRKGSVLDYFIFTQTMDGLDLLSSVTSSTVRCTT